MLAQEVEALLQLITPQNSHIISKRILSLTQVANDEEVTLTLLRIVLDRAATDPRNAGVYLALCQKMSALKDGTEQTERVDHESQPTQLPVSPRSSPSPPKVSPRGLHSHGLSVSYGAGGGIIGTVIEQDEYINPFLTPKTPLSMNLVSLNTPAMPSRLAPHQHSPPLTPPKSITRTPSDSTTTTRTVPPVLVSSPSSSNPIPTRGISVLPSASLHKMLPDLPETMPYPSPPTDISSIHRWLNGIKNPMAQSMPSSSSSSIYSVNSVSHILDRLNEDYDDMRDNLLGCMDYADSKTICYVACAIAEKATENIEIASTCAKLCVDLENALLTKSAWADANGDDETDGDDDELSENRSTASSTVYTLTADMFKRLLAIFSWQNFEFAWVAPPVSLMLH